METDRDRKRPQIQASWQQWATTLQCLKVFLDIIIAIQRYLGGGLIYNNAMHRFRLLKLASPPDARLGHFSLKGNAYQQSGLLEHRKKAFLYMPCSQQTAVEITNVPFNDFYHEDTNDT